MTPEPEKSGITEPSVAAARLGHSWGGEVGGLLLLALSAVFMIGGVRLGLGVPTRLGTGAFPFLTGLVLAILAVFICIEERRGDTEVESPDWIAFLAICGALAVFATTANRLGLVPATFLTIVVASLPGNATEALEEVLDRLEK